MTPSVVPSDSVAYSAALPAVLKEECRLTHYRAPDDRFLPDLIYFVTMSLLNRQPIFQCPEAAKVVYKSLQFFHERKQVQFFAYVIMPDHFHAMLHPIAPLLLPDWARLFKKFTTNYISNGEPICMKSYWSKTIVTQKFLYQKLHYIHNNPVRAGLVENPEDYRWSSATEYLTGQYVLVTPL